MVDAILFTLVAEAKEDGVRAVFDDPERVIDLAFEHLRSVTIPVSMAEMQNGASVHRGRDGEMPARLAAG